MPRFLLASLALCCLATAFAEDGGKRWIVVLQDGVDAQQVAGELGGKHGFGAEHVYQHALKGFAASFADKARAGIAADPRVKYVEEDRILSLPKPVHSDGKSQPQPPPQTIPTGIRRINAIDGINANSSTVGVGVAIIDTGIDLTHPDLNVVQSVTYVSGTRSANDDNGHGSHVSGIIAARDNNRGVVGVAPGAPLWAVKVLDRSGSGYISTIVKGIDYVTAHAGQIGVANMSLGGSAPAPGAPDSMHDAIKRAVAAGVVFVVAAGNENADASTSVPAAYPEVIAVSAIADSDGKGGLPHGAATSYGADDTLATFSNYGAAVSIAAPGVNIYSTYRSGGYATLSGTSMASPHVAGVVARFLLLNPRPAAWDAFVPSGLDWTNDVRKALIDNGTKQSDPNWGFSGDKDAYPEPLVNAGAFPLPAPG